MDVQGREEHQGLYMHKSSLANQRYSQATYRMNAAMRILHGSCSVDAVNTGVAQHVHSGREHVTLSCHCVSAQRN